MAQEVLQRPPPGIKEAMEKISPTEELCIEHAFLDRIMLVMDHTLRSAVSGTKTDLATIRKACNIISDVVDAHHMKIEEDEIYPKFANDAILKNLVSELEIQHNEARKMVAKIQDLCKAGRSISKAEINDMNRIFNEFHTMIMAHAAREESVLFPAMQGTWSDKELDALKEKQEKHEEKLLGKDAINKVYSMIGDLEMSAGLESVRDFTRRLR
jgi:hemerythrin-like domain-containing protein